MDKRLLTWSEVITLAEKTAGLIRSKGTKQIKLYGVPRGGSIAVCLVSDALRRIGMANKITETADNATIIIDDIIDCGNTIRHFMDEYPNTPFYALYSKTKKEGWIIFPWEDINEETGPSENIVRLLQYVGDDPKREGLAETPSRVIKSYETLFGGYKIKPVDIMKTFNADGFDEMVLLKDIEFYSTCEHHMLPFFGKAHIAYIPDKTIIGISKLARLLEVFARRLQIQERLCKEITGSLNIHLNPKGTACVLEAQHFCMTARGVQKQKSIMVTSSLTGVFKDNGSARAEFMNMIKG